MTDRNEWHEGFPEKRGAYRCRIDGSDEIVTLLHTACTITDRHRWMTLGGHDVVGVTVEWTGEQLSPRAI